MANKTFFPEAVSGYELSPLHGWFSILEPAQMTNLCTHPSFEDADITLYSEYPALTGTIARTTAKQRRGAYSLIMTPAGGAFVEGLTYGNLETETDDINHTISFDIWCKAGYTFHVYIMTSAPAIAEQFTFKTKGHWERKYLTFFKSAGAPTAQDLYIIRTNPISDTAPFYVDGFLMTEGGDKSTYFDGDSLPYGSENNYIWIGEAHASQSIRSASELSSGIIRNLNDYHYSILGFYGLGLNAQDNTILENALLGGGSYQRGKDKIKEYSIIGALARDNMPDLFRDRAKIETLLRNAHTLQQPLTVRVELKDDCGDPFSQPLHLRSLYMGGFEGTFNNLYQERSSLQFKMDYPELLEDGDSGTIISTYQSLALPNRAARRVKDSGWEAWGVAGTPYNCKFYKKLGWVILGGNFGGTYINFWDIGTETWLGHFASGLDGAVHDTAVAGNNDIWITGLFNNCGGGASDGVAYYRAGTGWTPLTGSFPGLTQGRALAFDQNGYDLYVGGVGSVYHVNTTTLAVTNITPVADPDAGIESMVVDENGDLYAVGNFTTINSVAANYIAVWDGTTWSAIGTGLNDNGASITIGPDGNIYISGAFDSVNGISASGIAMYNRESFYPLGGGIDPDESVNSNHAMQWYENKLYVVIAGSAGGCECVIDRPTARRIATWNGSNWSHLDFLPAVAAAGPFDIAIDNNGTIYYTGFFTTGESSAFTVVNNPGTASSKPVITIRGEMVTPAAHTWDDKILWIKNETTNQTMYLDLDINQYETITIDLRRDKNKIVSDSRGDVINYLLPSSEFSDFHIAPGENRISVFIDNADLVTTIYFKITHDYIGGAVI